MRFIRQSTSVDLPIGPFVDSTDGFTAETALTITQPDVRLKKNAAAWAQKAAAQTLSHEENGYYEVTLDATDTDTLGQLRLAVNETGALPVWDDFMVMSANVWDSLFGSDKLQVDVAEWLGTAVATPTVAGVPEVDLTHVAGATTNVSALATNVDAILTDTAVIGALGAGLTGIPWNAAWDAEVQSEATDALNVYDPPTNAEMDARTIVSASYATASALNVVDDFLDTEVAAILAAVDTEVAAIKAVTDLLPNAGALSNLDAAISTRATPAQVNTEVVDALNVDTYAEPGQEAPGATISLARKINYLYKGFRNRLTQDATTAKLHADDATTVDQKATVSDDGVTFDRGEFGSGP